VLWVFWTLALLGHRMPRCFTTRRYTSSPLYAVVASSPMNYNGFEMARCLGSRWKNVAVRLSQAGIVSKHLGRIELVFGMDSSKVETFRCMPIRKFGFFQKWGYFPLELCPKLSTLKMSPRKVDRVVNITRRRSSLLTTFATVLSTRRGCLLRCNRNALGLLVVVVDLLYN